MGQPEGQTMKVQVCKFKRDKDSEWEEGLAVLKEFDTYDVDYIIPPGDKLYPMDVWTYKLRTGELCYLETNRTNQRSIR